MDASPPSPPGGRDSTPDPRPVVPEGGPPAGEGWPRRAEEYLRRWVRGQRWWIRAPLLAVMGWILVRHLTDPRYASILHGLTLGFHELGHLLAGFVGPELFTAAAGTLLQLLAPLGTAAYLLLRQHDPFGATFGTFWLGTSLVEAGRYIADARARVLPLVSPFGPVDATSHDWAFILSRLGLLEHDRVLGAMARDLGVLVMVLSLAAGVGVLRLMATTDRSGPGGADSPAPRDGAPSRKAGVRGDVGTTAPEAATEPRPGLDRADPPGDPRTQNAPWEEEPGGR